MKSLLANPIRTNTQFSAGGDRIPIQTRASGQTVVGFSTQGLPRNNRTTLGPYRMGDSDGIAPPSALYPGDIFPPNAGGDRHYPEVARFVSTGNTVFQPDDDSHKLHSLLKALGDQKYKYDVNAPFADYFATQRLAREVDETSRNASVSDLGHSREILRNLVDMRRKQANDDFMRKMLDAGMSIENAEDEIDNVRRASALMEARKIEDRTYQAKLLLSRIAQSRGVTPNIQEPLTSSTAIEAPQRSQAMSSMMGMPGEGFGTSPLDTGRQFMTPDFYRRFLRRSALTQESGDQQAAMANLISEGGLAEENMGQVTQSAITAASLSGAARENAIENMREMYASRVESLRKKKVLLPLPPILFGNASIRPLYSRRNKEAGDKARFSVEVFDDLPVFQKVLAVNQLVSIDPDNLTRLKRFLQSRVLTKSTPRGMVPIDNIRDILAEAGQTLLGEMTTVRIPFVGEGVEVAPEVIVRILEDFQNIPKTEFATARRDANSYAAEYGRIIVGVDIPESERERALGLVSLDNNTSVPTFYGGDGGGAGGSSAAAAAVAAAGPGVRSGSGLERISVPSLKVLAGELGIAIGYKDKKPDIMRKIRESGLYEEVD